MKLKAQRNRCTQSRRDCHCTAASNSRLARNVRPLIVLVWVAALLLFITLDSLALDFTVRDAWVSLYEVLTLTAVGGYFTLRSLVDKRPPKP